MPAGEQPAVLTFLLTDIEGSTRLWSQHEDVMDDVIARHDELIREAVAARGGDFVKAKGEGDSTFSVFTSPRQAVLSAVALQSALGAEPWPRGIELRTRVALHTGEARYRDGDYHGSTVNRCARLRSIAHGGQIVVSQATADLLSDDPPENVTLRDLGAHGLRDLSRPERVFQVEHPDLPSDFAPLRSLGSVRSNLPAQRSSFIGRAEELQTVAAYVADNRVTTLTGVGGCGKTRLAVEAAAREMDAFEGVYFCDLSTLADHDVVAVEVARSVGVVAGGPLSLSARAARDDLIDYLGTRRALLVIDNCEHLIDATAALVDEILNACPEVKILATSREALEVDGERTYTVPSLAVPDPGETNSDAVRLFAERAAAVSTSFAWTEEAASHIAEICRRLDGIPLAIELAAAQSSALSPQQIEDRLSDRFRLLSGGRRRVQRQQTLATMLDWSHDLLDDGERAVLRRLAVFPQPFTLEQAEGLVGTDSPTAVASSLRALLAKSLLTTAGERYRLLETVRLYAEQKLFEAGEADEYRTRHRDYFRRWIESFDADDEVWTPAGAAQFVPELDHIRAALRWSDERDELPAIASIISRTWLASAGAGTSMSWFERASQAELSERERLRLLTARAWHGLGGLDLAAVISSAEEALTLPDDTSSGLCHGSAHAFLAVGHAMTYYFFGVGDPAVARQHVEAARSTAKSVYARVLAGFWGAAALNALRDDDAARATLHETLALGWRPDSVIGASHTILALLEHLRGDNDAAVQEMERSVAVFTSDAWGLATEYDRFWTCAYGPMLFAAGRLDEGVAFMRDLVAHQLEVATPATFVPVTLGCLGAMLAHQHQYEAAVPLLIRALDQPVAAIDHIIFTQYMDQAKAAMTDAHYQGLIAKGRATSFAEAAGQAFAVLETLS